jgi:hypothetical protein
LGDDFSAIGNPVFVPVWRINLTEPTSIPITACTYEDLRMEVAGVEGLEIEVGGVGHGIILDEKIRLTNLVEGRRFE